ncbi:hypothetical protein ACVWW2_007402 [Bradyrhizobium sp. LM4.3]
MSLTLIRAPRVLDFTPAASKRAVSRTVFAPSGLFSSFVTSTQEVVLKQKECAVLPLPKIALTSSDYPRLEQLARLAIQIGDPDGIFLMGEINRADIVPDECGNVRSLVTIGSMGHPLHELGRSASHRAIGLARGVLVGARLHFGVNTAGCGFDRTAGRRSNAVFRRRMPECCQGPKRNPVGFECSPTLPGRGEAVGQAVR